MSTPRPRNGDVDDRGRVFCDGCLEWIEPEELRRVDNHHRVGFNAGGRTLFLPMRDDTEDPPVPERDPIEDAYRASGGIFP